MAIALDRYEGFPPVSAGFPPRRAIVEKAAISEGLEVSALSALSAARFAVECTPKVRQINPGQFLRRGTDEATIERNG